MKTPRLIETFNPRSYVVHVTLSKDLASFGVNSTVTGIVPSASKQIHLHCRSLSIDALQVQAHGSEQPHKYTLDKSLSILTIELEQPLAAGDEVAVSSEVSGDITQSMHGIYPAHYQEGGESKVIISTQFESHHAREVFPCVDEPEAKATFDLTITTRSSHEVVANTPIHDTRTAGDTQTVSFETTPVMSSYLLAFASGEFSKISTTTSHNNTRVSIYSTKEHADKLEFALKFATQCLEFYEEYFGIAYPLDKCDHIAIPEFASGAMENWGCITYRETALIVDPRNSSTASKQMVAAVIAHELAHQWFGNLVTMKWWDDLWLNEGFASWITVKAVDAIHPEWKAWDQFVADDYSHALGVDALQSGHPILVPVEDPREINEIFDSITYNKGPSILRMLNDYIGSQTFQEGLRVYLNKHKYGNATTDDLWNSLSSVANIDVGEFMETWTEKTGYPVVTVGSAKNGTTTLTQQRFSLHPKTKPVDYLWHIPLFTASESSLMFEDTEANFDTAILEKGINIGRSGLYRVAYPTTITQSLAQRVSDGTIAPVDRLGLLNDTFESAEAGKTDTVAALELLKGFASETDANVWDEIVGDLTSINGMLFDTAKQAIDAMHPFVSMLISAAYDQFGWEQNPSDSTHTLLARQAVLNLAVHYNHNDARDIAERLFNDFRSNNTPIPADYRGIVYSHMVREHESSELYDWFVAQHNSETLQEEKSRYARALTTFAAPEFVEKNIAMMKSDMVRQQDVISWLARLLGNRESRSITWSWYQDNWDWLVQQFGDGHLYNYLALVLSSLCTFTQADEIRTFFKDKNTTGMDMTISQSLEKIEACAYWRERDQAAVHQYFKSLQ